jgi:hypothetical protein
MEKHSVPEKSGKFPQRSLEELARQIPEAQQRALRLDQSAEYPAANMDCVRRLGDLATPTLFGTG